MYDVHECQGLDGCVRPGRIAEVRRDDQPRFLADDLGYEMTLFHDRR